MDQENLLSTLLSSLTPEGQKIVEDTIKSGNEKRIRALQDKLNTSLSSLSEKSSSTNRIEALRANLATDLEKINQADQVANRNRVASGYEMEELGEQIADRKTRQILERTEPLLDRAYGAEERRDNLRSGMYDKQLEYQRALNNKQLFRDLALGTMFMFGDKIG